MGQIGIGVSEVGAGNTGPYLTIEPEAAPEPDAPSAPAMRVHIEIPVFTLVETVEATIIRFGSLADVQRPLPRCLLSGVKRT